MRRPSDVDIARLEKLGWIRTAIFVPPEVRAWIKDESQWQKKSMSSFMWEIITAVCLKAHDSAGKTIPEMKKRINPETRLAGHERVKSILLMAVTEKQRLYEEVQEFKRFEVNVPAEGGDNE